MHTLSASSTRQAATPRAHTQRFLHLLSNRLFKLTRVSTRHSQGTLEYHRNPACISKSMSRPSVPTDWPGNQPSAMPATQSQDVSQTSGLASGFCIAFVIVMAFTIYVLRRRIFPFGTDRTRLVGRRSDTLTLEALALLPTHKHKSSDDPKRASIVSTSSDLNHKCCSICTEPFMSGAELRRLPCGHQFDRACIDPWLCKRSATCPLWYVFISSYKTLQIYCVNGYANV